MKSKFLSFILILLNCLEINLAGRDFRESYSRVLRRIKESHVFSPFQISLIKNLSALTVALKQRTYILIKALELDFSHDDVGRLKKGKLSPEEFAQLLKELGNKLNQPYLEADYRIYERAYEELFSSGVPGILKNGEIKINATEFPDRYLNFAHFDLMSIYVQMGKALVDGIFLAKDGGLLFGGLHSQSWVNLPQYAQEPISVVFNKNIKFSPTPIEIILLNHNETKISLPLIYTYETNQTEIILGKGKLVEVLKPSHNLEKIFDELNYAFPQESPEARIRREALVVNVPLDERARLKRGIRVIYQFAEDYKNTLVDFRIIKIGEEKGSFIIKSNVIMEIILLKDKTTVKLKIVYNKLTGEILAVEKLS
ncbi:MAG: hypothetical protein NC920_05055 [Candidatus Omnitrophica bacterium]|nr:hypothetical protein [Candidatus Omnitrophota bacterium]MCM8797905.1 hypothetical protein [Candidatus Omnitrophota bacterium]